LGGPNAGAADWNGPTAPRRIDLSSDGVTGLFGAAVGAAGDVNGDGYGDFVVGAPHAGRVHVYLGNATPSAADWNGAGAHRLDLDSNVEISFGLGVAGAGDVNNDGYSDLLVGSFNAAHLYLGGAAPNASDWQVGKGRIDLGSPNSPGNPFGSSVSGAGDVNGDGYADFLVGGWDRASPSAGEAHVYLGGPTPSAADWNGLGAKRVDLVDPDDQQAEFGFAVAAAGDYNDDGNDDFFVTSYEARMGTGAYHLYLGAMVPDASVWNAPGINQHRLDRYGIDGFYGHYSYAARADHTPARLRSGGSFTWAGHPTEDPDAKASIHHGPAGLDRLERSRGGAEEQCVQSRPQPGADQPARALHLLATDRPALRDDRHRRDRCVRHAAGRAVRAGSGIERLLQHP
jgi:hypothetical protein